MKKYYVQEDGMPLREIPATLRRGSIISYPSDAVPALADKLCGPQESTAAVLVDHGNHIIKTLITTGTEDQAPVYPKNIIRECLQCGATGILLAHNHPSGANKPSPADMDITRAVTNAANLFDIRILDHLILTGGSGYFSFRENGLL